MKQNGKTLHNKENGCDDGETCNRNTDNNHHVATQVNQSKSCGKKQGTCSKKVRTHEGWNYRWTKPQEQTILRQIIPGPFLQPKLAYALPYVVTSNCKDCIRKNSSDRKLRSGIPDPWLEYLAWKENSSPKDARSSWDYMWLTDFVWNNRRLAMVQGIPDPWRVDFDCSCFDQDDDDEEDDEEDGELRKKPRRISGEKVSRASAKRDSKDKDDEKKKKKKPSPEREKKRERNAYEKVKDNMTELEDELRLRDVEKKILRRASAEKATVKSKSKVIHDENAIKNIVPVNASNDPRRNKARVSFQACKNEIKKYKDDVSKIQRDAKLAQQKIQKLKEEQEKRHSIIKKKEDKDNLCAGKCGRVCRDEKLLKTIKINDDEYDTIGSAVTTASIKSAREFLKEINDRIEITKNALNSPDMSKKSKSSSQKRERGAGDNYNHKVDEVIDLQPSLFSRRRSVIPIDWRTSEIPDHVDIGSTCLEQKQQCYRETSLLLQRLNRATVRESEVLIVEPFSEQD